VETVTAGWNRLAGVDEMLIVDLFENWFPKSARLCTVMVNLQNKFVKSSSIHRKLSLN